jgi:eukaryotic-like serine/threonine-protein kinase
MNLVPEDLLHRSLGGYRLETFIGPGPFAWVFAARGPQGRRSAVKVLPPRYVGEPQVETRFHHEAETAADLRHPHVVRIRKIGRKDDVTYFAMDYYPSSLATRIERHGPLEETAIVRMGSEIAKGLEFVHGRGIVHCDIKPHNILFSDEGTSVLADFGIARAIGDVSESSQEVTIGTPNFLSPEQARGLPLDGRSDLYSLGITLYKAATGSVPFHSTDWYELARMHVEDLPEAPRARRSGLNPHLDRLICRLLAKRPEDRYESAADVRTTLRDIGHELAETPAPPVGRAGDLM